MHFRNTFLGLTKAAEKYAEGKPVALAKVTCVTEAHILGLTKAAEKYADGKPV